MRVHTCGGGWHEAGDLAARIAAVRPRGDRPYTVDVHCHAVVPAVETLVAECSGKRAETEALLEAMGEPSARHNRERMLPEAGPRLVSLEQRLADMDALGIDLQVLSPSPTQYCYWADVERAQDLVRRLNEGIAAICEREPGRLVGLGSVALQHGELAARQLDHAVRECGLRGVEISSNSGVHELDDESLAPFWAKAEALGCVVFIHPFGTSLGARLSSYYLQNTIGQPLETTIALSHLIFGGVLDRHPALRILAAHGGGYLPHFCGRSNHAWHVRPEAGAPQRAPSEYLRNLWYDTVVHDPWVLEQLVARVGASRLLVGTDYPYDMGSYPVRALVEAVPALAPQDRAAMLGGNAVALFGLTAIGRAGDIE